MPNSRPAHRHSFLSANSLRLREDDSVYGFPRRHLRLFVLGFLLLVIVVTLGWRFLTADNSPYHLSTVREKGFSFTASFYKSANIQQGHDVNYLVYRDKTNHETSLWVTKIDHILSCGNNPQFDFNGSGTTQVRSSCYRDRTLFVADVYVNNQTYQINLTSDQPLDVGEAAKIFSSVSIN